MADARAISTDELQTRLQDRAGLEFWNVLTDEYFTGEFIPGSRRVPLDQAGREAVQTRLAKDADIIVYCSGPTCPQSRLAAEKLSALGYTNVRAYEGGLESWKNAGLPLEKQAAEQGTM